MSVLVPETLLVLWLVVVMPFLGARRIRVLGERLRDRPTDEFIQLEFARRFVLRWSVVVTLALGVLWLDGAKLGPPVAILGDEDGRALLADDALLLVALLGVAMACSLVLLRFVPSYRKKQIAVLARLRDAWVILPRSAAAALAFVAVALTAGVCEEIVFRRLVPVYVTHLVSEPLSVPWLLSSVTFGLAHRYQGPRGMILTGFLGALFYGLVVATGALWPAIVVHTLFDIRVAATYAVIGPVPIPARGSTLTD